MAWCPKPRKQPRTIVQLCGPQAPDDPGPRTPGVLPAGQRAVAQLPLQHQTLAKKRNTPLRGREDRSTSWRPLNSHPWCLLSHRLPLTHISRGFWVQNGKEAEEGGGGEDQKESRSWCCPFEDVSRCWQRKGHLEADYYKVSTNSMLDT